MPRIPLFKLRSREAPSPPPDLASYVPALPLDGIQPGIDNLRSDVYLSPKFEEQMRTHLSRFIVRYGGVERVLDEHNPAPVEEKQTREMFVRPVTSSSVSISAPTSSAGVPAAKALRSEPAEIKKLLTDIHMSILQSAKREG